MKKIITKNAPLFATAVLALSTLFTASHADGGKKYHRENIRLELIVPAEDFIISGRDGVSLNGVQTMSYDSVNQKLRRMEIPILIKTSNKMEVTLDNELVLDGTGSNAKKIPMDVSIGSVKLAKGTASDIGSAEENKVGNKTFISIEPRDKVDGENLPAGYYSGNMYMSFESNI